jgi:hypothetical protein
MPFDYGLRLNNRQRIANAREKPIEANKNQSVDGAEGLFPRSGSPQNVDLLPQRQNFRLERCPRPKQIYDHPNNEPDKISHPATASPDFRSTASQIEFATGTPIDDGQFLQRRARLDASIAAERFPHAPYSGLGPAVAADCPERSLHFRPGAGGNRHRHPFPRLDERDR